MKKLLTIRLIAMLISLPLLAETHQPVANHPPVSNATIVDTARQESAKFIVAAKAGDDDAIKDLLSKHVFVNAALGDGMTALHWAAYNDDLPLASLLLHAGALPEPRTRVQGITPLLLAAGNGSVTMVDLLLTAGANANTTNEVGTSPLMQAASSGNVDVVNELLAYGADINAREKTYGQTALIFAASRNRAQVVKVLLQKNADSSVKTTVAKLARVSVGADGEAVDENSKDKDKKGTAANDEGKDKDKNKNDDKSKAADAKSGSESVADVSAGEQAVQPKPAADAGASKKDSKQIDAKSDAKLADTNKTKTEAHIQPKQGEGVKVKESVLAQPESDAAKLGKKIKPGQEADAYGFTKEERKRHVYGSLVVGGLSALSIAARDGQIDAVRELIDGGADINQTSDTDHATPLILAIINGHYDLAKFLLNKNANAQLVTDDGVGPLYATLDVQWSPHTWYPQPITAQEHTTYIDLLNELITHKADIDPKISKRVWYRVYANDEVWVELVGATPFLRAAMAGDLAAMRLFVEHGADPKIATVSNDTALMLTAGLGWAAHWTSNAPYSRLEAVKFCLVHGNDLHAVDSKGYTALHGAAFRGDNEMVKYLIAQGADVKAKNKDGETVADLANGLFEHAVVHPDTVTLLEGLGSQNNHNCRSNECVVPTKEDKAVVAAKAESDKAAPTSSTKADAPVARKD